MAAAAATAPVLVRAYTSDHHRSPLRLSHVGMSAAHALPPISSFAFADILRSADSPEFQQAIDGVAEICAKSHMSLADEYASHLPPLGEITAANSTANTQQLLRPGMRRALTSVPEASSGSSEGSKASKKRKRVFSFGKQPDAENKPAREIRIGSMGRTISVGGITALAISDRSNFDISGESRRADVQDTTDPRSRALQRRHSEAAASLQRLLVNRHDTDNIQS